ncbi:MAG: PRC-barrel domain-containing protein [Ignavibacteria bacterium]|jgi:sporulation protein YlmC with PRC-barrel domain|nr:PRC-barrel domain-containing protein [Ignavibacteria bacterium]
MRHNVNSLVGFTISATDGELGKVNEYYFDDKTWSIRYMVVDTGSWFSGKRVLIPHSALGLTDWKNRKFKVNLTMEQVRNSPDIETEKTVTRQHEIDLFNHYGLPVYWGDVFIDGAVGMIPMPSPEVIKTDFGESNFPHKSKGDPHLRSTKSIEGYHINAKDGEIGHVEDYVLDDKKWDVSYLVVDTQNWLPGKKVLIPPKRIYLIEWSEQKVYVDLSKEAIENSAEFDPTKQLVNEL